MKPSRISHPEPELEWLSAAAGDAMTGYDQGGWEASILHAMYIRDDFATSETHDDEHRSLLATGERQPRIINGVNLDDVGAIVSGGRLGFVPVPPSPWKRVRWFDHISSLTDFTPPLHELPGARWFPYRSWPLNIEPPNEGSLDGSSLDALVEVLGAGASEGLEIECLAFYCHLASGDYDSLHLWLSPLGAVTELVEEPGPYQFAPSNLWPRDRSWFVYSDYDLWATKVSGSRELIDAIKAHSDLETFDPE